MVPMIGAWNSNNIGGGLKRGVGIAMQVGIGNLGGAIAGFVYLAKDQPRYVTSDTLNNTNRANNSCRFIQGHTILIGLISMSFLLTGFMTIYLRRENERRDALMRGRSSSAESYGEQARFEEREKGDYATFYRYTV